MNLSQFCHYLEKLEQTSKRLEITDILTQLIEKLEEAEIDKALYLTLGSLKAPFESEKFNMAEKMVIRAIAKAHNKTQEQVGQLFSETGDLGNVCQKLQEDRPKDKQQTSPSHQAKSDITIIDAYDSLLKIAQFEGTGSQENKVLELAKLINSIDAKSAKYIVRIVLGTMRLGFTELTIIDALVLIINGSKDKQLKKDIEAKYSIHPNIGLIAKIIKKEGISGIKEIKVETGVPILSQKAQRLPSIKDIIEKMDAIRAEYKFDGTRVQLHLDRNKKLKKTDIEQKNLFSSEKTSRVFVKTFTRNLEETSYQYPDLIEAAQEHIDAKSIILDGEAIGIDKKTGEFLPFQQIMQRKRKHDVKEMAKEVPLKYFVFDMLYLDGKSLVDMPLTKRRELLEKVIKRNEVITVDNYESVDSVESLTAYFEKAKSLGLEGLILKNANKNYQAGARSFDWVKLKVADMNLLNDTIDCVVLGYYFGRGERAKFGIGGFLVGVYDSEKQIFKTLTKVGTGLKDDDWKKLKKMADKKILKEKPKDVELNKIYNPDVWIKPEIVVELGGDELSVSTTHSAKFALRFPRLIKFREDKGATETTTLKEITNLYNMQKRGYYE